MYNVVTGTKRSGTSAMMLALRQAGHPILGFRYPIILKRNKEVVVTNVGAFEPVGVEKEDNQNGFWEMGSITDKTGLLSEHKELGYSGDVIKIMASVFPLSDPMLINKTIVMARHPIDVIDSKTKCKSDPRPVTDTKKRLMAMAYICNIGTLLKWLVSNSKEFMPVFYDEMIANPKATMKGVCEFLGRGNYRNAAKFIDKKLCHDHSTEMTFQEVSEAVSYYKLFKKHDIRSMIDYDLDGAFSRIKKLASENELEIKIK
jgi:hypothetical protein